MIQSFRIKDTFPSKDGLVESELGRLGNVVVLAGSNGSGKTRLLRRVELALRTWSAGVTALLHARVGVHLLQNTPGPELGRQLDQLLNGAVSGGSAKRASELRSLEATATFSTDLVALRIQTPHAVVGIPAEMKAIGTEDTVEYQLWLDELLEDRDPAALASAALQVLHAGVQLANSGSESARISQSASKVVSIAQTLIPTAFGVDSDGRVCSGTRPFCESELSPGELRLLQSIPLVALERRLPRVLILDEPETHLHPDALVKVVRSLAENENVQLWIATHSLPLVASLDADCLWSVADGRVEFVGAQTERVLEGLLGGEENAARLYSFLGEAAQLAATRFACECLSPPATAAFREDDPQITQCIEALARQGKWPLRIVDWGAGQGRLASGIAEQGGADQFDYFAFDPSADRATSARHAITRLHGSSKERYFNSLSALRDALGARPADCVVMSNVLHEIHPSEWLNVFGPAGMGSVLGRDGLLVIVEDLKIPRGEMAHPAGFILLDAAAVRCLFDDVDGGDVEVIAHREARYASRLFLYAVPAACLLRVSRQTINRAVNRVRSASLETLRQMIEGGEATKSGREYARAVHQYANAALFLEGNLVQPSAAPLMR